MMHRIILILFTLFNINTYAEYDVLSGIKGFEPIKYFDNFTSNPSETGINKNNIESASLSKAYNDNLANELRNNFDKRSEYTFTENELSKSSKVIKNSNAIVNGITNTYTDCKTVKKCEQTLGQIKHCEAPKEQKNYKCEQERTVDVVIPDKISKRIKFTLKVTSKYSANFKYDVRHKKIIYADQQNVTTTQDYSIDNVDCSNFDIKLIEIGYLSDTFNKHVTKTVTINNDCQIPVLNISIDQGGDYQKYKHRTRGLYALLDISSQKAPVITDSLNGSCPEINKRVKKGICKVDKQTCIGNAETKIINGVPITRDCWRYQTIYKCNANPAINTCEQYEANKCVQVGSQCKEYDEDICIMQTKSYQCPIQSCTDDTNIICGGDFRIECLDGSCVEKAAIEDSGFVDSISKLAIISDALKGKPENFTEDSKFIFSGKVMSCRKTGYGFSDCCKNSGWGVDLNLAHCSSEEKELGELKEKNLAIYVGKNVHKTTDLEPERVDKRYCVFGSKIARILQEQGRFGQLGINFGTPKYPDCSGLSPKQLAQINMGKIDLSEISKDIASKHQSYDPNELGKKLTSKIQQYYIKE